jgi:transposase-like protein
MTENRLVAPSSFCWNKGCPDYGKVKEGNIVKFGRTQKGTQRYQCKTCKRTFVSNIGTVFYYRHHPPETILECLALVATRNSLASIHWAKGIKEETVLDWLQEASCHAEEIEALLMANHKLTRVQLDAMWTYVGHKGEKGAIQKRAVVAPSGVAQQ